MKRSLCQCDCPEYKSVYRAVAVVVANVNVPAPEPVELESMTCPPCAVCSCPSNAIVTSAQTTVEAVVTAGQCF
jgi:hypothetical protein